MHFVPQCLVGMFRSAPVFHDTAVCNATSVSLNNATLILLRNDPLVLPDNVTLIALHNGTLFLPTWNNTILSLLRFLRTMVAITRGFMLSIPFVHRPGGRTRGQAHEWNLGIKSQLTYASMDLPTLGEHDRPDTHTTNYVSEIREHSKRAGFQNNPQWLGRTKKRG